MQEKRDGKTAAAAIEYVGRKTRALKPRGEMRGLGWWPGVREKRPCCDKTPYPSGLNNWVKLKHCCTGAHVANLYNCDEKTMKKFGRELEKTGVTVRRDHYTLLWQLRRDGVYISMDDLVDLMHLWERESDMRTILALPVKTRKLAVELVKTGIEQADAIAGATALS